MLIRKIELSIINEINKGVTDLKNLAEVLALNLSTVKSTVRTLVSYRIIQKTEHGTYVQLTDNLKVASDKVVNKKRRNSPNPKSYLNNPLPQIKGEELESLMDYVKMQCEANVPRSILLERLKRNGYSMKRMELLLFIEYFRLAPKRKPSDTNDEALVA